MSFIWFFLVKERNYKEDRQAEWMELVYETTGGCLRSERYFVLGFAYRTYISFTAGGTCLRVVNFIFMVVENFVHQLPILACLLSHNLNHYYI